MQTHAGNRSGRACTVGISTKSPCHAVHTRCATQLCTSVPNVVAIGSHLCKRCQKNWKLGFRMIVMLAKLGCTQWRIWEGGDGDDCPPLDWSLKSFFGNQFSQFVVNFLFHGLRKFSPITNLSPQYLCFCANKFSRSTPAGKCWSFTHSLMT